MSSSHGGPSAETFHAEQKRLMRTIVSSAQQNEPGSTLEPFYVIDLGDVVRKHAAWCAALPRVEPFYAFKCNGEPRIVDTLATLGTGFDCASQAELRAVVERGVPPERIIYAHPSKPVPHLLYARSVGVTKMTFDNADELRKVAQHYPTAALVLRVLVDDQYSVCRFGVKFGAPPAEAPALLQLARELGLGVVGVSFHVGSGCRDARAYRDAIAVAAQAMTAGRAAGHAMTLLDLGGGYPGTAGAPVSFTEIAATVNAALEHHFPASDPAWRDLRVIAEPGRYMVASAASLAVNITSKRTHPPETGAPTDYYVNDGVYGSFNCILFDHQHVTPELLFAADGVDPQPPHAPRPLHPAVLWGPTCDSMDCITRDAQLPDLPVGAWLFFGDMGAYTMAAASTFNGFPRPRHYYLVSSPAAVDEALENEQEEDAAAGPLDEGGNLSEGEPQEGEDLAVAVVGRRRSGSVGSDGSSSATKQWKPRPAPAWLADYERVIRAFAEHPNFTHVRVA